MIYYENDLIKNKMIFQTWITFFIVFWISIFLVAVQSDYAGPVFGWNFVLLSLGLTVGKVLEFKERELPIRPTYFIYSLSPLVLAYGVINQIESWCKVVPFVIVIIIGLIGYIDFRIFSSSNQTQVKRKEQEKNYKSSRDVINETNNIFRG